MTRSDDPPITFLRLFSDEDGESHFEAMRSDDQHSADTIEKDYIADGLLSVRVVPPRWDRDWGPSKQITLAVYISGAGVVEASDGDHRSVHPGVVLLAEDLTGRGHAARVSGDRPLAVAHIVLCRMARP